MIDRINREFQILAAEQKRLQKLSSNITVASPTFASYVQAIKSVSIIVDNLAQSFTELLTPVQIKQLSKIHTDLVAQLLIMVSSSQATISKIKSEKQHVTNKNKTQNCSVCGENIHESNIKQALMGLEEESKQNFHMAMQQFKKIAEEPIYTKQENNEFQERLHFLLSQRQRVLSTNCHRIQQFAEIMDSALADLRKLKDADFMKNQPHQHSSDFANANKMSEDVSNFLQQSFSKKIPPWIHKMFLRMMTSYIQECSANKIERAAQTSQYEYIQSKDVREIVREKQSLQKQNKEISDQLKELKLLYKKLEQINFEYTGIIASLNRSIKFKQAGSNKQLAKMRRNSRNITKIIKGESTPRDGVSSIDQNEPAINYSIFENDENSPIIGKQVVEKKRKKQFNSLLPQIKRNRFEKLSPTGENAPKANQLKKQRKQQIVNAESVSSIPQQKMENQFEISSEIKNEVNHHRQPNQSAQTGNKVNLNKNKMQSLKAEKLNGQAESSENEIGGNQNPKKQKKSKGQQKIGQNNKSRNAQINYKKSKTTKLTKVNLSKKGHETSADVSVLREDEDSGIRQLYEYVANIKLNKKANNQEQQIGKNAEDPQNSNKSPSNKIVLSHNKQNQQSLQKFNKRQNSKQLTLLKKISRELTEQIMNKRSSLYGQVGELENQKQKKDKKATLMNREEVKNEENTQVIPEKNEGSNECKLGNNQSDNEYEQQFQQEQSHGSVQRNTEGQSAEKQESFQKLAKLRNSQNTYLLRKKFKQYTSAEVSQLQKFQSLGNFSQSKGTQRKLFQILRNHNVIGKSVDYHAFSSLIEKLEIDDQQPQIMGQSSLCKNAEASHNNAAVDQIQSKKPSIFEEAQPSFEQQAHNSVYGRLFLTKAVAYKYEQSMAKSYHKKIIKQLDESQRNFCNKMYSDLCDTKKLKKQIYQEFCSILRYPYQALYSKFEAVKFMSEMSLQTFQYFFRKIVWIHRKCQNEKQQGVCRHIVAVREELLDLLHKTES